MIYSGILNAVHKVHTYSDLIEFPRILDSPPLPVRYYFNLDNFLRCDFIHFMHVHISFSSYNGWCKLVATKVKLVLLRHLPAFIPIM